jgi:hypothetical protein
MGLALTSLGVLSWFFAALNGECGTKRKKANMSIENTKKEVAERLDAFRKTGELTELRNAANLIERIEVLTAPTFEDRQTARTTKLSLWLTLLDTIDSAKDPKFDPADMPATRVSIPSGTAMKPGVPIVSPEGIADPAARRKYDEAVKANAEKTKRYRFQKELRQLDSELSSRADGYIAGANLKSPQSLKEMNAAIAAHVHNQERAAHLRSLVAPE